MITLATDDNILSQMITLAPDDNISTQMITLASDDNILFQMITLAPDDNISSQMITLAPDAPQVLAGCRIQPLNSQQQYQLHAAPQVLAGCKIQPLDRQLQQVSDFTKVFQLAAQEQEHPRSPSRFCVLNYSICTPYYDFIIMYVFFGIFCHFCVIAT